MLNHAVAAHSSGFQVVRADKEQPLASHRIGVDRDHRNSRADCRINRRPEHRNIRHGDQNAGRLRRNRLLQFSQFRLRIVVLRTNDLRGHLVLCCGLVESLRSRLPVRQCHIRRNHVENFFVRVPVAACRECNSKGHEGQSNTFQCLHSCLRPNVKNFGMREITTPARALCKIGRMVLPERGACPILSQRWIL